MTIELRSYQQDAIDAWFDNDCRGIYQMATGTGKTYTAIATLDRLQSDISDSLLVVVGAPYTHLADQWRMSLADWDYSAELLYGSRNRNWKTGLSRLLADLKVGIQELEIVVSTHATMSSEYFRSEIRDSDIDALLIADEVHSLGAPHYQEALLETFDYRLGLSATPERYYDEEGTEFLLDYFEGVVFEYSLADAIPEYLVPYDYHPVIVELTPDELEEYRNYTNRLRMLRPKVEDESEDVDEELIQRLEIQRARIIKTADNKFGALEDVLETITPDHLLVYTNHKQIDEVQNRLNERRIRQHKFTAEEDDETRARLLERFDEGELAALVAMKCLDEGVDVPSTRQGILMSNSGNPMQFIQRRGRLLRPHPGKESATIYDMLVVPSTSPDSTIAGSGPGFLQREIRRFEEFAETARNELEARNKIQPIRTKYEV